ncbi:nucleotidyltransferase family protein [Devosia sp. A16]|uniref:nucleotidyltransferase family protein n=1 Tax=Devosia sp. A16 TaxID=1736675 RepID=UPI0006D78B77|nr:nucleotidyltransferase family protein [Devosia sp. A16]
MRPSKVFEKNRGLIREVAARYRVANPRVFGSVLHGSDKEGSDIDIVVDVLPDTSLFDLTGLQSDLEQALGVPVDVITSTGLHRFIRDKVLAEAQPV